MPERIILVDSNSLIYRGYFAIPPLTTTKGELSNATFGFASILLKAIEEIKPQHIAAAFDLPGKTFRHERDATYKATRKPMPDELRPQFERCKELLGKMEVEGPVLLVLTEDDANAALSFRNLPEATVVGPREYGVYELLRAREVVLSRAAYSRLIRGGE